MLVKVKADEKRERAASRRGSGGSKDEGAPSSICSPKAACHRFVLPFGSNRAEFMDARDSPLPSPSSTNPDRLLQSPKLFASKFLRSSPPSPSPHILPTSGTRLVPSITNPLESRLRLLSLLLLQPDTVFASSFQEKKFSKYIYKKGGSPKKLYARAYFSHTRAYNP